MIGGYVAILGGYLAMIGGYLAMIGGYLAMVGGYLAMIGGSLAMVGGLRVECRPAVASGGGFRRVLRHAQALGSPRDRLGAVVGRLRRQQRHVRWRLGGLRRLVLRHH